jgi:TolB-like protein
MGGIITYSRYDSALAGKKRITMSFVGELKRRNVVRVGIAYAVIGWVLAQIGEFAFENFGAPDWVLKSFVVLLLLGFPIVLIFAWAYEVTPDGIKREKDVDRSESITPRTGRKMDYLIIGVLVVAVAILGFDEVSDYSADSSASTEIQSIAVLPFVNMSGDEDYFADGLTEELLNLLAQNTDLKVAGRTSSFAFKGKNDDLREIGDALGVTKVLEGSVRRDGERVRVTAQLINVEDGFHIWSDTYDRGLASIFEIQDEVAGAITQALELHLTPAAKRLTNNPEAYALYLQALGLIGIDSTEDLILAIQLLGQATALDPEFAKAYELKAMFHWMNAGWTVSAPVGQSQVYAAAKRALEIDPDLPGAIAFSISSHPTEWTWMKEFEAMEALTAVDRSVRSLDTLGVDLNISGYYVEAEQIFRQVIDLDPLAPNAWERLSDSLSAQGRIEEAKQAARRSAELQPQQWGGGILRSISQALLAGEDEEAIRLLDLYLDEEYLRYPSARAFVEAMRHAETGRNALQEWVEYRSTHFDFISDRAYAEHFLLIFGHVDLYIEAIDSYGPPSKTTWLDAELLEMYGQNFMTAGYRKTQHYLERVEGTGLIDLWDHRGAPDHCSKETGEWVCH